MVKSKRMSKTSIAVIVLAILLVLSMVLGLTGAWYSASSANSSTASNYSFTLRSDWITLSASGSGSVTVTREVAGTSSAVTGTNGAYVVMPGDVITSSGSASFSVTNSGKVGFYYVIEKDDAAQVDSSAPVAQYVAAGDSAVNAINVANTLELTDSQNILNGTGDPEGSPWTVDTNLTHNDAGKSASIHFGSYKIYAIQAENMTSAANAYAQIKAVFSKSTGWPAAQA